MGRKHVSSTARKGKRRRHTSDFLQSKGNTTLVPTFPQPDQNPIVPPPNVTTSKTSSPSKISLTTKINPTTIKINCAYFKPSEVDGSNLREPAQSQGEHQKEAQMSLIPKLEEIQKSQSEEDEIKIVGYKEETHIAKTMVGSRVTRSSLKKFTKKVQGEQSIDFVPGTRRRVPARTFCATKVPLAFVALVTRIVQKKCNDLKMIRNQLQIYMNDLPSNDFNLLFRHLMNLEELKTKDDGLSTCFVKVLPGSYYDKLFPRNTLHLVHAHYTLHWLIKAPRGLYDEQGISINKGNVYISETSLKEVAKAYFAQFEQDFTQFLQHRSDEVVGNGCMLLTLSGRPCSTDSLTWTSFELKLLTKALTSLVSEGLIKEEKLDKIDFPIYYASAEQLESIVEMEGSFTVENCKTMAIDVAREIEDKWERARNITNFIRAFSESLVSRYFGEEILSPLYDKLNYHAFQRLIDAQLIETYAVNILLRKK